MDDTAQQQLTDAREQDWQRYQDKLGNLTTREESMIQRAYFQGWADRDKREPS